MPWFYQNYSLPISLALFLPLSRSLSLIYKDNNIWVLPGWENYGQSIGRRIFECAWVALELNTYIPKSFGATATAAVAAGALLLLSMFRCGCVRMSSYVLHKAHNKLHWHWYHTNGRCDVAAAAADGGEMCVFLSLSPSHLVGPIVVQLFRNINICIT